MKTQNHHSFFLYPSNHMTLWCLFIFSLFFSVACGGEKPIQKQFITTEIPQQNAEQKIIQKWANKYTIENDSEKALKAFVDWAQEIAKDSKNINVGRTLKDAVSEEDESPDYSLMAAAAQLNCCPENVLEAFKALGAKSTPSPASPLLLAARHSNLATIQWFLQDAGESFELQKNSELVPNSSLYDVIGNNEILGDTDRNTLYKVLANQGIIRAGIVQKYAPAAVKKSLVYLQENLKKEKVKKFARENWENFTTENATNAFQGGLEYVQEKFNALYNYWADSRD